MGGFIFLYLRGLALAFGSLLHQMLMPGIRRYDGGDGNAKDDRISELRKYEKDYRISEFPEDAKDDRISELPKDAKDERISESPEDAKVDRISELPEDVLSYILSLLTLEHAVKARVLSSRWRYLCSYTPNLNFDLFNLFGVNANEYYWRVNSDSLWEAKCEFIRAVNQFLDLYRSQRVYSLRVCFCLGNESACHIDRWISFAVERKIEKLDLNLSFAPKGNKLYTFPCHLLPQDKGSRLKHMSLHSCMLRPSPEFRNSLSSLKTLDLDDISLDQSAFDNILSSCIDLEWLRLNNCRIPRIFLISGNHLLHLKTLVLCYCQGADKVEVSSIDLTTFEYIGKIIKLSLFGVWSLEKVHLMFRKAYKTGSNYMFSGLAKDLPQLQTLSLVLQTDEILPIPESITTFSHLKELVLIVFVSSNFNLLSVASVLDASPCLQKLHLSLHMGSCNGSMVERVYSNNHYYQLKEVEISGFYDKCNALELAIYLLSSAVGLERMIINSQRRYYRGAGEWHYFSLPNMDESEKEQVHGVLLKVKAKIKPNVQLIFL